MTLEELNFDFIESFYHYLINDKIEEGKKVNGICNNTAQKYVQTLRASVFYAIKKNYLVIDPFKEYEYEWDDVETVYLTKSEVAQIENHKFESKALQVCADIFLFTCYTGFAPIDLKYISWDNMELRDNGKYWFNVVRHKTDIKCEVMMFKKTHALISKYIDDPLCKAKNMLIPYRANQTMNEYLKQIADHVGITKNLTHYVARHTFATTTMLANGASLEVTKRAMGHARQTQTEHYGKIVDEKVTSEMERVDSNLESTNPNYEELAREKAELKKETENEKEEGKIIQMRPSPKLEKEVSEETNKESDATKNEKDMFYTRRKLAKKKNR